MGRKRRRAVPPHQPAVFGPAPAAARVDLRAASARRARDPAHRAADRVAARKSALLEGKLGEFVRFGEDNDAIGEKVHRLSLACSAPGISPPRRMRFTSTCARTSPCRTSHCASGASRCRGKRCGRRRRLPWRPELRDKAETMGARSVARRRAAVPALVPEAQEHIRSVALVPLGQTRTIGLLALGSEDPQRFFPEMGTLYLRRIGELTAGALAARA